MTRFARGHQSHIEGMVLGLVLAAILGAITIYALTPAFLVLVVLLTFAYSGYEPPDARTPADHSSP